jgi:hypothetical protein
MDDVTWLIADRCMIVDIKMKEHGGYLDDIRC